MGLSRNGNPCHPADTTMFGPHSGLLSVVSPGCQFQDVAACMRHKGRCLEAVKRRSRRARDFLTPSGTGRAVGILSTPSAQAPRVEDPRCDACSSVTHSVATTCRDTSLSSSASCSRTAPARAGRRLVCRPSKCWPCCSLQPQLSSSLNQRWMQQQRRGCWRRTQQPPSWPLDPAPNTEP